MKKRIKKKKLNLKKSHSKSLKINQLMSLLQYGKINTILAKAKVLKSFADEEISTCIKALENGNSKVVESRYGNSDKSDLMMGYCQFIKSDLSDSGFTKLVRSGFRDGDNSVLAEVSLLNYEEYLNSVVNKNKKATSKSKSKKSSSKKIKKSSTSDKDKTETEGDKGIVSKLGKQILGRKVKSPTDIKRQRSRVRSGI